MAEKGTRITCESRENRLTPAGSNLHAQINSVHAVKCQMEGLLLPCRIFYDDSGIFLIQGKRMLSLQKTCEGCTE